MPVGRHTLKLHGITIGYSELEDADPALGRARGRFRPGVGYELVQPVFRLFSEAIPRAGGPVEDQEKLDRYHKSRDALALTLEDDAGRALATSAIHIADYTAQGGGAIEIEALITDRGWWTQRAPR